MCGECLFEHAQRERSEGSSPRVRGMLRPRPRRRPRRGIIPACAGNAIAELGHDRAATDHPRVCGECLRCRLAKIDDRGSSPRVRGMLITPPSGRGTRGIIPACAGNAPAQAPPSPASPDHPRVCGECLMPVPLMPPRPGSSPRVRGMQASHDAPDKGIRIIPACAGNALGSRLGLGMPGDHPRVCGECRRARRRRRPCRGSSPRVRGMRDGRDRCPRARRIIPACAGNARWSG